MTKETWRLMREWESSAYEKLSNGHIIIRLVREVRRLDAQVKRLRDRARKAST